MSRPAGSFPSNDGANHHRTTKKALILEIARSLERERFTPAEIEKIRRHLVVRLGAAGKVSPEHIAGVLKEAGIRVSLTASVIAEKYEEQFQDLLHFATLEDAEICLVRLDELLRKFRAEGERAAEERVLEVARLGRRRAEMIARNRKVDPAKRAEKEEIVNWFRIWLETPDLFFDWLDLRKQLPEFQERFATAGEFPLSSGEPERAEE